MITLRTHYDTPDSPLAEQVKAAMTADAPADFDTAAYGSSYAKARLLGGHVFSARVMTPGSAVRQELLYPGSGISYSQLRDPKLRASHFGAPVGPDGFDVGNKHGAFRYTTYERVRRSCGTLLLRAALPEAGISAEREVVIRGNRVAINDALGITRSKGDEETSMLSHLYLNRGGVAPSADHPVLVNGEELDDLLHEDGAGKRIINGVPYLWTGFGDVPSATVRMPDGSQIDVSATVNGDRVSAALLWAPKNENAFCIEPVDGFSEAGNRGRIIPAGGSALLAVTLTAMQGAIAG
jgi:hypothetical protein